MKLKAHAYSTETLITSLTLISHVRKVVVFQFTPGSLNVILVNTLALHLEPQIWCKMPTASILDLIEVQSLRENTILLEINVELFLQALRNYERTNSQSTGGVSMRLQRKDTVGGQGVSSGNSRTASLALFYTENKINGTLVNHTFRIPVKILKETHEALLVKEPELSSVDVIMRLPSQFASIYKRLDKFRRMYTNENILIRASSRAGGYLGFELEEEGQFKVTVGWNQKLDVQRPTGDTRISDSIRETMYDLEREKNEGSLQEDDVEVLVKLREWRMTAKVVSMCKRVILIVSHNEACMLHCVLDDTNDIELIYYLNARSSRELD